VFVEVEHEVVGDDGVSGGEEGDEALDDVDFGRSDALLEIDQVGLEIDFFDGPRVLDAVAEHVIEDREAHRAKRKAETGIEDVGGSGDGGVRGMGDGFSRHVCPREW